MFLLLIPFIFRRFISEASSSSIVIHVSVMPFFQSSLEPFPRLTVDTDCCWRRPDWCLSQTTHDWFLTSRSGFLFASFFSWIIRFVRNQTAVRQAVWRTSVVNIREHGAKDPIGGGNPHTASSTYFAFHKQYLVKFFSTLCLLLPYWWNKVVYYR